MAVFSSWRHRRDLSEIGRMYLLVVGLFLLGLLVWKVAQLNGNPWDGMESEVRRPSPHYGR